MTKAEFIAKYGLEKYIEHNEVNKANYRRKHPKKEKEKKVKSVRKKKTILAKTEDMVIVKFYRSLPQAEDYLSLLKAIDKELAKAQRRMRAEWGKQTDKPHILVLNGGNIRHGKYSVLAELHQLGMSEEEQQRFKDLVKELRYERDN